MSAIYNMHKFSKSNCTLKVLKLSGRSVERNQRDVEVLGSEASAEASAADMLGAKVVYKAEIAGQSQASLAGKARFPQGTYERPVQLVVSLKRHDIAVDRCRGMITHERKGTVGRGLLSISHHALWQELGKPSVRLAL